MGAESRTHFPLRVPEQPLAPAVSVQWSPGAGGAGGLLHIAVRELVEGDRLAVLALASGSKHRQAQASKGA